MIVQNVSATETGLTDISFTLPKSDGGPGCRPCTRISGRRSASPASSTTTRSASSRSSARACARNPGVSATFFQALADAGVNIEMISTSEIRISVVTRDDQLDAAVRAVHSAFGLDSTEGEAVVYGGTGR